MGKAAIFYLKKLETLLRITASLFLVSIFITGCGGSKVVSFLNDEFSFQEKSTYVLVRNGKRSDSLSDEHKYLDSLMINAINSQMALHGFSKDNRPDLLVYYDVIVNTATEQRMVNNYNRYNRYDRYDNYYYNRVSTTQFREGLLLIEIKDRKGKLAWQGSIDIRASKKRKSEDIFSQAIADIFNNFEIYK